MFEKTKAFFKRIKRKVTPTIVLIAALIIYVGYVHVQLGITISRQDKIIYSIAKNVEYQNIQNVKTHSIEIKAKIDNYKETKNILVDAAALDFYSRAYELARMGDKSCYVFEMLAENVLEMYWLGVKDGNKTWGKRNNSF